MLEQHDTSGAECILVLAQRGDVPILKINKYETYVHLFGL